MLLTLNKFGMLSFLLLLIFVVGTTPTPSEPAVPVVLDTLRVTTLGEEDRYEKTIDHLVRKMGRNPDNPTARKIARVIQGTSHGFEEVSAERVAQVVRVESRGDSMAVSSVGALGLGQVRPEVWLGQFPQCGNDLFRVRDNICYTFNILERYKKRFHKWDTVLLYYVGCSHRHPSCLNYPRRVLGD